MFMVLLAVLAVAFAILWWDAFHRYRLVRYVALNERWYSIESEGGHLILSFQFWSIKEDPLPVGWRYWSFPYSTKPPFDRVWCLHNLKFAYHTYPRAYTIGNREVFFGAIGVDAERTNHFPDVSAAPDHATPYKRWPLSI